MNFNKDKLRELRDNPKHYIEKLLKIRDKNGNIVSLEMKPAQQRLYDAIMQQKEQDKPIRIIILKARQMGFSTVTEALMFQATAMHENVRTDIVAHESGATANLFRMNKLFYDELPDGLKPMRKSNNAQLLSFENPTLDPKAKKARPGLRSSIRCITAGDGAGRSDTLTNIHASEVAFWADTKETLGALVQTVPDKPNTMIIIESTANGYNYFKDMWDKAVAGKSDYVPIFFPWFEDPDYTKPVPSDFKPTEAEKKLKKAYKLTDGQLVWRRWCIENQFFGDEGFFNQEYPACPEDAFIASGNPYFDNATILSRIRLLEKHFVRGRYIYGETENGCPVDIEWQEDPHGEIWKYAEPLERHPYVAGADTSGDGSDRFTGYLLDNSTGYQVAQLFYDGNSELYFTQQLYCLGKEYNEALLGVEINFSSYPEKKLEEWHYRKLYIREKPDDMRGQLSTYKWGWRTDMRTRPLILANLQTLIKQNSELIMSEELLRECLVFIRNEAMRPEAAEGEHDDLVICAAIANYIRPQQRYEVEEEPHEVRKKLIDDPRFAKEKKRLRR